MNFTFGGESARKRMLLRQERAKQEALRLQKAKVVVTSPMIQKELATPDNMTIYEAKLAIKHEEELLKRMKEEEEAKKKEELLEKKRARRLAAKNARAEAKKKNKEEPVKIEEVVVTESIGNLKNEVVAETQE